MARSAAPGLATPAAPRGKLGPKARSARKTGFLAGLFCAALLTLLLLPAFASEEVARDQSLAPAPAKRLLPSGPPKPEVVAVRDNLRILLPIARSRVTAVGYHGAGSGALALEPVGRQANAGLFTRLVRRLTGKSESGLEYYLLGAGAGPQTGGLDVGAPVDTDVYAPVDGTVIAVTDYLVNGVRHGVRIDLQPSGNPGVVVAVDHLRPDPALTVGTTVSAARTKIGRVIDLSRVERAALARHTQDKGHHVHVDVRPAASLAP